MSQPLSAKMIVNTVGVVAALIVGGWVAYSALKSDAPAICEGRYPTSTRFSLTSENGQPVSLSELQARIGSSEWGLMENALVLEPKDGDKHPVLAVRLAEGTSSGYKPDQQRGGLSFAWMPSEMRDAAPKSACLSYRLFFPPGFAFAGGGSLPGLGMGDAFEPRGDAVVGAGAAARPGWSREGSPLVNVQFATDEGWKNPAALNSKKKWPSGRWVNVEQEVILNDAGKKNGIIRLWLDGELIGENKKIGLRGDEAIVMSGVMADIHYGSVSSASTAPADTQIRVSPFIVRWQ